MNESSPRKSLAGLYKHEVSKHVTSPFAPWGRSGQIVRGSTSGSKSFCSGKIEAALAARYRDGIVDGDRRAVLGWGRVLDGDRDVRPVGAPALVEDVVVEPVRTDEVLLRRIRADAGELTLKRSVGRRGRERTEKLTAIGIDVVGKGR